jgi:hypothetical protein
MAGIVIKAIPIHSKILLFTEKSCREFKVKNVLFWVNSKVLIEIFHVISSENLGHLYLF